MAARNTKEVSPRLRRLSNSAAQTIQTAAKLLDEEMAAGIVAAQRVQRRFRKERRIDRSDFRELFDKFQSDGHGMIGLLGERVEELGSKQAQQTASRFVGHAHSILDLLVEIVSTGAELADQLAQRSTKPQRAARAPRAKPRR